MLRVKILVFFILIPFLLPFAALLDRVLDRRDHRPAKEKTFKKAYSDIWSEFIFVMKNGRHSNE